MNFDCKTITLYETLVNKRCAIIFRKSPSVEIITFAKNFVDQKEWELREDFFVTIDDLKKILLAIEEMKDEKIF